MCPRRGRRSAQGDRVGAGGVLFELCGAIGVVGELRRARGDAGEVAVPQRDEAEREVERLGLGTPLGAAGALGALGDAPAVLLARQQLELLGDGGLDLLAGAAAALAGGGEEREPGPLGAHRGLDGRARERLGTRAQLRAVPERDRGGALAVAEREASRGGGARGRDALLGEALREALRGHGSKRTGWQREAIVGSTSVGWSVSRSSTT